MKTIHKRLILSSILIIFQISCTARPTPGISVQNPNSKTARAAPTSSQNYENSISSGNLTPDQVSTLSSLEKVDDYPLYTMHHQGSYTEEVTIDLEVDGDTKNSLDKLKEANWTCSLFAALGDDQEFKFGRNFDWEYSPGLLLFTNPPDGYASVSMVDIAYLGFEARDFDNLHELELAELAPLLDAPNWPFDGMNEAGLAIGMAAVPSAQMDLDPEKSSIGSLEIMRRILDDAANIHEAVSIMESYNIDFRGGPDLHYLIADQLGEAILVEFFEGEMRIIPNDNPWHLATNFLTSSMNSTQGQCARYDKISDTMLETGGNLSSSSANELLSNVSQNNTQWSVVYNLQSGIIQVTMDRQFDQIHKFQLIP